MAADINKFYIFRWLEHMGELVDEDITGDSNITWAAYHASKQAEPDFIPAVSSLLPLFNEDSNSTAMMCHALNVVKAAISHLNPTQVPCITMDQPLYALVKQIQWTLPNKYGEDKFVIMLGPLHIEMALWRCLGQWLDGSGWTEAITQAEVASPGVAGAILKAAHVARAKHAHQVTACSLQILLNNAYIRYQESTLPQDCLTYEQWLIKGIADSPMYQYWFITLELELLIVTFLRSVREGKFDLYLASLNELAPYIFALDHTHYARWLSVHLRDMAALQHNHPDIYSEFISGGFVVRKTATRFSAIATDQAHEQNNAMVKGDGGAVGLMDSPSALIRWMVAGPELARLVTEFEENTKSLPSDAQTTRHREQTKSTQVAFHHDVQQLVLVFEEMGNPFTSVDNELLVLDNKDLAASAVIQTVRDIKQKARSSSNNLSMNVSLAERNPSFIQSPVIRCLSLEPHRDKC